MSLNNGSILFWRLDSSSSAAVTDVHVSASPFLASFHLLSACLRACVRVCVTLFTDSLSPPREVAPGSHACSPDCSLCTIDFDLGKGDYPDTSPRVATSKGELVATVSRASTMGSECLEMVGGNERAGSRVTLLPVQWCCD